MYRFFGCLVACLTLCCSSPGVLALTEGDDELAEDVRRFQQWFEEGYNVGGNKPCPVFLDTANDGMRMGVFAKSKITSGSLYLSIPQNLIIGEHTIYQTPRIGPAIGRIASKMGRSQHQVAMNLFITYERFVAKESSFFYPYIKLLPTEHDVPEYYSDDELALLRGTLIPQKARHERTRRREDYDNLLRSLKEEPQRFPLNIFTFEHYAWAQGILNTRMIWWDGAPHLVPMLDMINCKEGPDPQRVHQTKRGASGRADTYAPWTFQKGDQIFENYGQPNPTYMLWHGFALASNVHDCAQIEPNAIHRNAVSFEHRQALQQFGLHKTEFCVRPEEHTWREFVILARVVVMNATELKSQTRAPMTFVSRSNEGKALTLVKKSIQWHLDEMIAAQEIDDLPQTTSRMVQIRTFLQTQRKLLSDTVSAIERKIAPLRKKRKSALPSSNKGEQSSLSESTMSDDSSQEL